MRNKPTIDIKHVANLARIEITGEAREVYQRQLDDVVSYIDKISGLDVSKVDPTLYGRKVETAYREDVSRPGLPLEAIMDNAPDQAGDTFKVPKIIE